MLSYLDDQEDEAKKFIGNGGLYQNEDQNENELEHICGGKEAEIESALEDISRLRENEII
jgi:hypothetical protein